MMQNLTEEKLAAFLEGRLSDSECEIISHLIDADETLFTLVNDIKEIDVVSQISYDDFLNLPEEISLPIINEIHEVTFPSFPLLSYDMDSTLLLYPVTDMSDNVEVCESPTNEYINLRPDDYDVNGSQCDTDYQTKINETIDLNSEDFLL